MDILNDKEIEKILNPTDKSEDWPEFEIIKDDVVGFMGDLPIETYEHLFKAVHKDKDRLMKYLLDFPTLDPDQKKCFNSCPECGASDPHIIWGDKEWFADTSRQAATCNVCSCVFSEIYQYTHTEIEE